MKLNKIVTASAAFMTAFSGAGAQEAGMLGAADPGAAGPGMVCRAYEHIDGQLGYIKEELKITAEQEPQWTVFANTFRAGKEKQGHACKMAQERSRSMLSANLPNSMKMAEDRLTEQLEIITRAGSGTPASVRNSEQGAKKDRRRDHERRGKLSQILPIDIRAPIPSLRAAMPSFPAC